MKQRTWNEQEYHCDAALGSFVSERETVIRLWAPTAQSVVLYLYTAGHEVPAKETVAMEQEAQGAWVYKTARNLDGYYYDFDVTVDGKTRRTADPYAVACGVNGNRSMILNLARTNPEEWEKDVAPAHTPEQVIYELHVKDFSWDEAGGFAAEDRGKFSALCRQGTTLHGEGKQPTGLDYLKSLGVTHIQLMPVYDYGSVDEANREEGYNWGYDPMNYNVPEGSYASDPYHGEVRVRELKEAIASLHKHGFRVIMDVVYNHTYVNDSWLWRTVPGYYYRQKEDGTPSNGSGCGNDIASERSMVAKYILESVLFWTREYHMDGFRFDLMGLLDQELMDGIQEALDAEFGPGEKLVYGEPWRADDTAISKSVVLCDKGNLKKINGKIGAFCDDTRDAVKGSLMNIDASGFVNGGGIRAEKLRSCLAGWAGEYGAAQTPAQTITYLSCHDDWTLWDKLVYTMDEKKNFEGRDERILKANRLAAAINFCCQGRVFFLSGEEFGRTKGGIKNSFCSPSSVNKMDWARAWKNKALVDYYRGLIGLRQQMPGMQDKTADAAKRILWVRELALDVVAACVDNHGEGSAWSQIAMVFNCSDAPCKCHAPEGVWNFLVEGERSDWWKEERRTDEWLTVEAGTALVIGRIS